MSREQRLQAVNKARSLVGAKWRHRGRQAHAVDCIGLLVLSYAAAGLTVPDRRDYGREPWNDGLQAALVERFGPPRAEGEAWQPGDTALFRWANRPPCHVGLLADYRHGGLSVIHAHSMFNVAEHGLDRPWRDLLVEVYNPWHK